MSSLNLNQHKTMRLSNNCPHDLVQAADILKAGGLVALPTETVYGLAANGLSSAAIEKVFVAKNRPSNNPLILHIRNEHDAIKLFDFSSLDPRVKQRFLLLAARFWPGPITIVSKKAAHVPDLATANLACVAVRMPKNQITLSIMAHLDFPLVMPSANLSTRPSPTCADHVLKTLDKKIDAIVDDGICEVGIESTVVKIDDDEVRILRLGMIGEEEIENCLNEKLSHKILKTCPTPLSPGQYHLHYSPSVMTVKLCNLSTAKAHWLNDNIILATKSDFQYLEDRFGKRKNFINFILSDNPTHYAKELYHALYMCERTPDKSLIIVSPSGADLAWQPIVDRLIRSAGVTT